MTTIEDTETAFVDDDATTIAPAKRSSGAWLFLLAVLSVIVVALAAVAGMLPRQQQQAALAATTRELALPTVKLVTAAAGKIDTSLLLPAEIKAYAEAPIFARANGYVKQRLVDLGAEVEAGQLLAELDTPELQQGILEATAQLNQAEAAQKLSESTAGRFERLLKDDAVSAQEASEKAADLTVKKANVEAVRANLKRLQDLQAYSKITAPFKGRVTARRIDVGDLVSATSSPGSELFHIAQLDKLRVFVRVPQSAMRSVKQGSTADVLFADLPKQVFKASVVRSSGSMSTDSRTLLVELELDNANGELVAGSYAQVRFTDGETSAALTLPANTLIFRAEGSQVAVVKEGKVELRKITMGRDHGPTYEVLNGISTDDRVIINPPDSLVTGAMVRIAESKEGLVP